SASVSFHLRSLPPLVPGPNGLMEFHHSPLRTDREHTTPSAKSDFSVETPTGMRIAPSKDERKSATLAKRLTSPLSCWKRSAHTLRRKERRPNLLSRRKHFRRLQTMGDLLLFRLPYWKPNCIHPNFPPGLLNAHVCLFDLISALRTNLRYY